MGVMSDGDADGDGSFNFELAEKVAESLLRILTQITGEQEIEGLDLNPLFTDILNIIPGITISEFELARAVVPIPGYRPGIFPDEFIPIKTIEELNLISSQSLAVSFDIEVTGASRIKARGFGELDLYKGEDGILEVKAKDLWYIEEVKEVDPDDEKTSTRIELVQKIIKEIIIKFVADGIIAFVTSLTS